MKLLLVWFTSQIGWFIRNLCGESCLAMSGNYCYGASYTVRQVSDAVNRPNNIDTVFHLQAGAERLGVPHDVVYTSNFAKITGFLNDHKPVTVLVNYRDIPDKALWFNGLHFILLVGYDSAGFIYHDPLFTTAGRGANKHLTHTEFRNAWADYNILVSAQGKPKPQPPQPPEPPIPIEEEFDMSDPGANIIKRAEIGARLVTKDNKTYYLRIGSWDYWIPSEEVMVGLGFGVKGNVKWGKATKVSSIKSRW